MSHSELIESLRRRGEEQAWELWRQAEAEAGRLRAEARRTLEQARSEEQRRQLAIGAQQTRLVRLEAERRARGLRTEAKQRLARRLHQSARAALASLRDEHYDRLFALLAAELPPADWEEVRVNPVDTALAARHFPGAQIVAEPGIAGGMEAVAAGGRIRIDNTLEKRLERAWDDLLVALLPEVLAEVEER